MVRHVFTSTFLLLFLTSAVSALRIPVPPRQDIECVLPHIPSSGPRGNPICTLQANIAVTAPTAQTLERRSQPNSRKARAKARARKGLPPATAADKKGRRIEDTDFKDKDEDGNKKPPLKKPLRQMMKAKKQAKVNERKENRKLAKKQRQAARVAQAWQKQIMPPYGIDPDTGALRKPKQEDVAPKAWATYNAALIAKQTKKQKALDQKRLQQEKNRLGRINTKAAARRARKAANLKDAMAAKTAFASTIGLPLRHVSYTSPQNRLYTGKDIRQAVFNAALATAKGGVGYNAITGKASKNKDKLPKIFENRPNSDSSIPLPGVVPLQGNPLKEFPIMHDKKKGYDGRKPAPTEARIIVQKNAAGQSELMGRIGHPPHSNDHVSF